MEYDFDLSKLTALYPERYIFFNELLYKVFEK